MNTGSEPMIDWYQIENINQIDSPSLIIYKERVTENIRTLKSMIDDIQRLRPHIKTHKTKEPLLLMMQAGINKFKCATIAEAEMLATVDAPDILLAYQPVGPKLQRLIRLIKQYPASKFSCLVDKYDSAKNIADAALENNVEIPVYIDVNVGMNRTGVNPGDQAADLYIACANLPGLEPKGLHVYDGHIKDQNFQQRTIECDKAFEQTHAIQKKLIEKGYTPVIVAGGSPTFPIHAKRKEVECSPGTFIYWDKGYLDSCPEQNFVAAALVISRIISLPGETKLCLDLGHKSIASENEISKRVYFLNAPELKFISHSEEHLVAETSLGHSYKVGDVLYGLPYHICPTCALYESAWIAEKNKVVGEWQIVARDKKITI
jgi:D-serine deaminase-like pyridoxal phosphate-dependent protein